MTGLFSFLDASTTTATLAAVFPVQIITPCALRRKTA
jgi:hypothetical protein